MTNTEQGVWINIVEKNLPYLLEGPPTEQNIFVRERELKLVNEKLDLYGVCHIYGGKGVGKTSIGVQIANQFKKSGFQVNWFSLSNRKKSEHDFVWSNLIDSNGDDLVRISRNLDPQKKKTIIDLLAKQLAKNERSLWIIDNLSFSARDVRKYTNQFLTDQTRKRLRIMYLGSTKLGDSKSSILLDGLNLADTRDYAEFKIRREVNPNLAQLLHKATSGIPILINSLLPPMYSSGYDIDQYVYNSLIPGYSPNVMRYVDSIIRGQPEKQIQQIRKLIRENHPSNLSRSRIIKLGLFSNKRGRSLVEAGILYGRESGYFIPNLISDYLSWMLGK